jgi:hypothetical protein
MRWALLESLLRTPPAPLDYSPFENTIVKPANRAVPAFRFRLSVSCL